MKKFYPYILVFISIILAVILFDYIKLPYNENNIIQGSAFIKRINPYNNLLKVYFFILFPLSVFLISYLYTHNALGIVPFKKNFFLNINNCNSNIFKHENKKINFFTFFLIFFLILEFLSLDFSILLSPIDIYHDGLILVPSYNSLFFKDYWISQAGQKGVKLDWFATWRNWVRSTNAPKQNPADIARVTVPMNNRPDPALEKIKEDAKRAAPPSLEVLAKMAALRTKA